MIVNWNTGHQLRNCLHSVETTRQDHFSLGSLIVVDNGSNDGSSSNLPQKLPLLLITNEANRGFAAACNQGARSGRSEFILFLNPDTRLEEDSLDIALRYMSQKENSNVGICGVQLRSSSGEVSRSCARFPSLRTMYSEMLGLTNLLPTIFEGQFMRHWAHDKDRVVDQIMGAFFLVRRAVHERLNGFDERFFVYMEDVDYSLRAKRLGYDSFFLAQTHLVHLGGGSSKAVKAKRLFYGIRSRILYCFKHFSKLGAALYLIGALFIEPMARSVFAILGKAETGLSDIWQAYGLVWGWILGRSNENTHPKPL